MLKGKTIFKLYSQVDCVTRAVDGSSDISNLSKLQKDVFLSNLLEQVQIQTRFLDPTDCILHCPPTALLHIVHIAKLKLNCYSSWL